MTKYPIEVELRIDWSEQDLYGHVNNTTYFKYIQASRLVYLEKIGLSKAYMRKNIGPILAATSCQFKKQMFFPGNIKVCSGVNFIKNSSFGIHHLIKNQEGEIVAEADDIIVTFDFIKNEKVNCPIEVREKIELIENQKF
ncbi:MAG: acyl-CoA thioesterase [Bacteroidetes bacterium]|nr:acyl-CoA thioesterase [Bacteroidota bacterium]